MRYALRADSEVCFLAPGFLKVWVTVARGIHPFPSRTRKLSLSAPMVLHARVCGRVGRCPIKFKSPQRKLGAFDFAVNVAYLPCHCCWNQRYESKTDQGSKPASRSAKVANSMSRL